jgi:hypothetical protein
MVWLSAAGNRLSLERRARSMSFDVGTETGSPSSCSDNAEVAVSQRCPLPLDRSKAGWQITAASRKFCLSADIPCTLRWPGIPR